MDEATQEYDPEGRTPFIRLCEQFSVLLDSSAKHFQT